jgi:hypothetical protein
MDDVFERAAGPARTAGRAGEQRGGVRDGPLDDLDAATSTGRGDQRARTVLASRDAARQQARRRDSIITMAARGRAHNPFPGRTLYALSRAALVG